MCRITSLISVVVLLAAMEISAVYIEREGSFDERRAKPGLEKLEARYADDEDLADSSGLKSDSTETPAVIRYCAASEPCKFTVCPWTRKLEEFGFSPMCYSVPSGCQCKSGLICAMRYDIYHRSITNTATSYCRAQPFKARFPFKKYASRGNLRRAFLEDNQIYNKN